jgi:hypothetical protein
MSANFSFSSSSSIFRFSIMTTRMIYLRLGRCVRWCPFAVQLGLLWFNLCPSLLP